MVDLNAHEAGNGGQMPREAYRPTEAPLLGGGFFTSSQYPIALALTFALVFFSKCHYRESSAEEHPLRSEASRRRSEHNIHRSPCRRRCEVRLCHCPRLLHI